MLEDYKSTILYCNKSIELDSINLNAYNLRASSYYLIKEYKKAIRDYSKLIELNFTDLKKIYFNKFFPLFSCYISFIKSVFLSHFAFLQRYGKNSLKCIYDTSIISLN